MVLSHIYMYLIKTENERSLLYFAKPSNFRCKIKTVNTVFDCIAFVTWDIQSQCIFYHRVTYMILHKCYINRTRSLYF